ncbi:MULTISPECIES: translation initiation factor [Olivibacter]|jgi:translation initiation factor 1|uniref:Translation initiation factor SUI1 n=2 Tax=Sphingobacteriaceae TaxID=84566 RepID=F4C541_SPHS2|nr:translation initiation factor [Olivibacter sp. 47]MDM8176940.1 translation initiation factor [Olivibacter sp. 47]MDX3912435.1 translation initiation factor [Pseudosphingobacterium sp.]
MAKQKKQQFDGIVYSTDQNYSYREEESFETDTLPAAKQQLRVQLDKKQRAGKAVTLITGFVGKEEDLSALGKQLKQRCGVGGATKEGQIMIQGDFRKKIVEILTTEGYKVKLIGG